MSNLRNKLIRLAHNNPELREDLLPLLKLGGRDDQWFKDENFRREKYYAVRDAVLKDIKLFLKTNAQEMQLYKKAYESALTLHSVTTNRLIKNHIESAVLTDGLKHAYEFGYKRDKEELEASVGSIARMIDAAFALGPQSGFVPDRYVGDRAYPLHEKVRRSLEYHKRESVKKWY